METPPQPSTSTTAPSPSNSLFLGIQGAANAFPIASDISRTNPFSIQPSNVLTAGFLTQAAPSAVVPTTTEQTPLNPFQIAISTTSFPSSASANASIQPTTEQILPNPFQIATSSASFPPSASINVAVKPIIANFGKNQLQKKPDSAALSTSEKPGRSPLLASSSFVSSHNTPTISQLPVPVSSFSFAATLSASKTEATDTGESSQAPQQKPTHSAVKDSDVEMKPEKKSKSVERRRSGEDSKTTNRFTNIKHLSMASPAEISLLKSLVCRGIHSDINSKEILEKHFSAFGNIEKISCHKRSNYAIIVFKDHDSAEKAKKNGCIISTSHNPVSIFWLHSQSISKKRKDSKLHVRGDDVEDELKSMLEAGTDHGLLKRPEEKKEKIKKSEAKKSVSSIKKSEAKKSVSPIKKSDVKKNVSPIKKSEEKKSVSPIKKERRQKKVVEEKVVSSSKADTQSSKDDNLMKILLQQARTGEERFSLLDARDKLIRSGLKKQSDLATASVTVGTCPDICPEKERYSRFAKNGLSVFELKDPDVIPKSLDQFHHNLVVKEYSRSSADQEEPLPHELRPTPVLMKTMDYLLCNVMEKLESGSYSARDWYDFIWSRTRAIRKDITQQHLCNLNCVAIVEKCARFHIHCAAALCEEDMAVFDRKINDENLTKCLQTLKHFYEDLWNKNITCPNEPEFRAYDILLSLNEGDALRHVQKLRENIRLSSDVQFAVSAALSYSSNNYVKFFRLVQEASYMSACILHRYFTRVRVQAIHIILKAYCAPNRTEMFPITDLYSMLMFESLSEVKEFCEMLQFKVDDNYIHLDRSAFLLPVSLPACTRSPSTVERKRKPCLGEEINKAPLPDNPLDSYLPEDSFDAKGFLKKSCLKLLEQNKGTICDLPQESSISDYSSKGVEKSSEVPETKVSLNFEFQSAFNRSEKPKPPEAKDKKDSEIKTSVTTVNVPVHTLPSAMIAEKKSLFAPVTTSSTFLKPSSAVVFKKKEVPTMQEKQGKPLEISKTSLEVIWHHITEQKQHKNFSQEILNSVLEDTIGDMSRALVSQTLANELRLQALARQAAFKNQALELQQENLVQKACQEIFTEILQERIRIDAEDCLKSSLDVKRKQEIINNAGNMVIEYLIDSVIVDVVTESLLEEHDKWESKLMKAKEKVELLHARKVFDIWKVAVEKKKWEKLSDSFENVPIIKVKCSPSSSSDLNNPLAAMAVHKHVSRLFAANVVRETLQEELTWMPLDLAPIFEKFLLSGSHLPQISAKTSYWKLLLLVFDKTESPTCDMITQWLCTKFSKGYVERSCVTGTSLCSLYWLTDSNGNRIAVCVRKIIIGNDFPEVLNLLKDNHYLEGTSAALMYLPLSKTNLIFHQDQLKQLFKSKALFPKVPLYCFLQGENDTNSRDKLESFLTDIKNCGLLSDFTISTHQSSQPSYSLSQKVHEAVNWLILNCQGFDNVPTQYLKDCIEDAVAKIFDVVFEDLSHRTLFYQDPMCIINFFNNMIKKKASMIVKKFSEVSWPLPELDGHCSDFSSVLSYEKRNSILELIKAAFASLLLPAYNGDVTDVSGAWKYAKSIKSCHKKLYFTFLSSVKSHLESCIKQSRKANRFWIPWADVLCECVYFITGAASYRDLDSGEEFQIFCDTSQDEVAILQTEWHKITQNERPLSADLFEKCSVSSFHSPIENQMDFSNKPQVSLKRKADSVSGFETSPKVIHFEGTSDVFSQLRTALESEKKEYDSFTMMLEEQCHSGNNSLNEISSHSLNHTGLSEDMYISEDEPELMNGDDLYTQIAALKDGLKSECKAQEFFESRLLVIANSYSNYLDSSC